jgi:glutamine---fructose-6-phosphate transaminase (isomerizing)
MSDRRPDWYTSDFPELRDGPPWVMQEMIFAQPDLVEPILGSDSPELVGLRGAVAAASAAGAPVVITGCGTSEHASLAIAALLQDSFRATAASNRAEAREALDAALDPRPGGVCIAISHGGSTRATQLALEAARASGATTGLVTARANAPTAASADHVVVTPTLDASWCHTLAYTSAILAGASIAAGTPPASEMIAGSRAVIETALGRRDELEASATRISRSGRVVTTGLGIDHIAARELALKIEEGARVPATALQLEALLHGYLAGCDAASTTLVMLDSDPHPDRRRDRRFAVAAQAAAAIGIPTIAAAPRAVLATLPESVRRVELEPQAGPDPLLAALLQGAVTIQLLTLALVGLTGTNPDLIRREQAAYREAARIAADASLW